LGGNIKRIVGKSSIWGSQIRGGRERKDMANKKEHGQKFGTGRHMARKVTIKWKKLGRKRRGL